MQNIEMHYFQLFFTWPLIVHVVFLNQCKRAVNVTKGILTCWPPGGRKYPKIDAGPLPVYSIPSLWTLWLRKRACCPLFSWLPTIFCHQRNINTWIEDPPLSPGYCSEHRKSRSKNKSEKKNPRAWTSRSQSGTEYVTVVYGTNIHHFKQQILDTNIIC